MRKLPVFINLFLDRLDTRWRAQTNVVVKGQNCLLFAYAIGVPYVKLVNSVQRCKQEISSTLPQPMLF